MQPLNKTIIVAVAMTLSRFSRLHFGVGVE
jgi:hypothetical protein